MTGVGYVKLGFERVMQERPDMQKGVADASERLATLERLAADAADELTDENDAEAEQLRLLMLDMQRDSNIVVREGLTFDYPLSYNIIPDTKCIELRHWTSAEWVAEEFLLSPSDIEEIYGVDVRGHSARYSVDTDTSADPIAMGQSTNSDSRNWDDRKNGGRRWCGKSIAVRTAWSMSSAMATRTSCASRPSPDVYNERFYPWYPLVFNEVDHEKELYPSDVRLMQDMQCEYNRCREGLKEQRIAARPFIAAVSARSMSRT
jgi:hypothetical protein